MSHDHVIHFPPHAKDAFPPAALERISHAVHETEKGTSAEVRISIRDSRATSEAGLSIKDIAMKEFLHLEMEKTKDRSGILLFILYDERQFYVLGDEGVHKRTAPEGWQDVAATLKSHFKQAEFEAGVIAALKKMQHHVRESMPLSGEHTQELPEEVVIH